MAGIRVQVGRPKGAEQVSAQVGAQLSKALANAVIKRVQARVNHPAADSLAAKGVNQYASTITGPRGGPGIIRPVRARVLRFVWRGQTVFAKQINGAGLLPLIVAEGERISNKDADAIVQQIKL